MRNCEGVECIGSCEVMDNILCYQIVEQSFGNDYENEVDDCVVEMEYWVVRDVFVDGFSEIGKSFGYQDKFWIGFVVGDDE